MAAQPRSETAVREVMAVVGRYLATGEYYLFEKERIGQKSAREAAGAELGISSSTVGDAVNQGMGRFGLKIEDFIPAPPKPEEEGEAPPVHEIKARLRKDNDRYIDAQKRKWRRRFIVKPEPFGIVFFGDPHLDNVGCNWTALEADIAFTRAAGLRAVQMGDLLDSFHHTGKLAKKQAANPVTTKEGLALARDFVKDSDVLWDAQILGNHDKWAGDEFAMNVSEWAGQASKPHKVYYWMAELTYDWGHGSYTVLAAHDFKGSSIHNPLHGPMRRAKEDGTADLYVAGHKHTAATAGHENGFRGKHYKFLRVRGYKDADSFAFAGGYDSQEEGRSALAVINPASETMEGRCRTFLDLAEGLEWLNALKARS